MQSPEDLDPDDPARPSNGPLSDCRVVEMGQLLAGPFCGQLLADFGAQVVKVEAPGVGDPMRQWGRKLPKGYSLWWPILARNKSSVTIDLRTGEGQSLVRRLIAEADVVVENFRPGTMERWGLGWEQLQEINPGLVMVRVTGFGQTGPRATEPGYGSVGEAIGGLRYVTGDPSAPPSRVGVSLGDALAGTFAALGALMALRAKDRNGRGQVVDVALYEAVMALMESLLPDFTIGGQIRERSGAILPNVAPSNVYPTADGQMVLIAANQDTVFTRLASAMGQPEMTSDPRFATHTARGEHQELLDGLISTWTASLDAATLVKVLETHSVPAGQIYRAPEMLADPHFIARESIITLLHPELGTFPMQNVVPRLSQTPGRVRWLGPELGQHNQEIFERWLGMTESELNDLKATGIV